MSHNTNEELYPNKSSIEIQGRTTLRTGSTNTYSINISFPCWKLNPTIEGISLSVNDKVAYVTAKKSEKLAGEKIILSCMDADDNCNLATIEIEVI